MAKQIQEALNVQTFTSNDLNKIKREMQEYAKLKAKMQVMEKSLRYNQQQLLLNHKDKKCYNLGLEIDKIMSVQ